MENLNFALAIGCLVSFSWGRKCFFEQSLSESSSRRGLRPLGTIFGLLSLVALFPRFDPASHNLIEIAVALFIISLLLFWSAVKAFSAERPAIAFSGGAPTSLICSGPYRWIRHPFYLSYIMFWLGCLIAVPSAVSVCALGVMTYLYTSAARFEESRFMSSTRSNEYSAYSSRAGMFIPKLLTK